MIEMEVLTKKKKNNRLLQYIPEGMLSLIEKRGFQHQKDDSYFVDINERYQSQTLGQRYQTNFPVSISHNRWKNKILTTFDSEDISTTGMLISTDQPQTFSKNQTMYLHFTIPGGVMPEGFEAKVHIKAQCIRTFTKRIRGELRYFYAFQFIESLDQHMKKRRWGLSVVTASFALILVAIIVVLMRVESVIFFKFHPSVYLYSIIAATFLLSRYVYGMFYKDVPINPSFEPGVSIIIPVFNEEEWIERTMISCIDQYYPIDQLEVIVVDDCSTDATLSKAQEIAARIYEQDAFFHTKDRLKVTRLIKNGGKREALMKGVHMAKHDLVVFVDSDSFLEPNAIHNLVQPFQDEKMGGVAGRTEVENKFTNALTKLQAVRYYIAFRIMKAAESYFDAVTCLSGPLSCYRKELILKNEEAWLNQRFLGRPATFGDDRSMTNYILKTHRTGYQDKAICSTIVPSTYQSFLKQQMRWKRSWLRESLRACSFIWRKEPFMFFFFLIGLIVPIAAPVIVVYNLIWVPAAYRIFPSTFLFGLLLMAALLSLAHLLFKRSSLWGYGLYFVLFYEAVLLWQMPVAWVTFWKSEWGTRETPQDILAKQKKLTRKNRRRWKYKSVSGGKQ